MEYPSRKKPFFKRPRKVSLSQRYPKTSYFCIVGFSVLVLFSRPIYDMIFRPPTVDPYAVDAETLKKIANRSRSVPSIF
ncbi:uncharacterized protein TNIN_360741 [Trichonephila inaurata madagascariensis]|uniref:Uncharacterized protein n=1 Tax=Trichonephila inaurata madagascariensis TaxID=2747483 RepID=A0A8X6WLK8_9ARAC|nr:uncharacterized protein TNIN_360741 [Trichonephila inaurata madagascariensis]